MFDRGLNRQPRTARRYRFEKKPVNVATVNQIHQHFTVIAASCDDGDHAWSFFAQLLCRRLDSRPDHRSIRYQDANRVIPHIIVRLSWRYRMMHVVQAAGRVFDRCKELFVLGHYKNINVATTCVRCDLDFVRLQCRHSGRAVTDDRGAVFRRLHNYVFSNWFVGVCSLIVCRICEGQQTHALRC